MNSKEIRRHGGIVMIRYENNGNPIFYVYMLPYHLLSEDFDNIDDANKYFDKIVAGKVTVDDNNHYAVCD
jgi:hypothetical protein